MTPTDYKQDALKLVAIIIADVVVYSLRLSGEPIMAVETQRG